MHHLWKISTELKMAVLTLKLGICGRANKQNMTKKISDESLNKKSSGDYRSITRRFENEL